MRVILRVNRNIIAYFLCDCPFQSWICEDIHRMCRIEEESGAMNYLGAYHSGNPRPTAGICDEPCVSKGRMMLCARQTASEGYLLAMVYGRIRNRRELVGRLGCAADASSAFVVLRAYQRWGTSYPKYIEGSVVTCVMDVEKDRMVLSRDRMGERPVFYAPSPGGQVVFADHPDSLLKTASAEPVVGREGLCEMFGLGPARTPGRTLLRDVFSLEAGRMLIGDGETLVVRRYFSLRSERHTEDETETVSHTRRLLEQCIDDVVTLRPGAMLSGGLDSTALTALLCRKMEAVRTFSVDYRDNEEDFRPNGFRPAMDAPFVRMAAEVYGTRHHTFILEQAALADTLETAVSARGFPGMADVDSSLLLFASKISKHASIVVSGECGDEVFGGYPWFGNSGIALSDEMFPWSGSLELRESMLRPSVRKKLDLKEYVRQTVRKAIDEAEIENPFDNEESRLKCMQKLCFRFFMPNLQERAVRMCGHCGVEVLTPLCDDRLVQYVYNVPWNMKFMNGREKGLFRAAVCDLMPEALNTRKKSPYPKTCSPIYTEIIRGLTMALLTDREAPVFEWIDAERLREIAESALDPNDTPWFGQLMAGPQMLAYIWQVNTWMRERNITVSL